MSTSGANRDEQHQTPPVDTNNQPKDGAATSDHPVGQAQQHQMIVDQPSDGLEIQEHNIRSPLPSSPTRIPSFEEVESKMHEYTTKIEGFLSNKTAQEKMKQKASSEKRQKRITNHYGSMILDELLEIEECPSKGHAYGLTDINNNPLSGSSDSLRAWWKEIANFDNAGPAHIDQYYKQKSLSTNVAHGEGKSTIQLLMELSDPTLGSILSLLGQHCDPPQNNYQYKKDPLPPWWPTGREEWWGQTGIPASEGPPPFERPHNLKKKWKVAVILGIIKSMSPNFSKIHNLLKQSGNLPSRMNAKELRFWNLALVAEAKLYCQEHLDMPADEAVAFVLANGSNSSQEAPIVDRQSISIPLAPRRNTVSAVQSLDIEAFGASSGGSQDSLAQTYQVPFVDQPCVGPSTDRTQDVQNQVHNYDAGIEFDEESTSG